MSNKEREESRREVEKQLTCGIQILSSIENHLKVRYRLLSLVNAVAYFPLKDLL